MSMLFEVQDLTHLFGGLKAVSNFNLRLMGGELVGLIGPNGAGKTTIFNLVCGVYRPTQGTIQIQGHKVNGLRPYQVTARGIARTFQNIRLWPNLTVLDNLRIARHYNLGYGLLDVFFQTVRLSKAEKDIDRTAQKMLDIMGLLKYAAEPAKNLPYGLQRRVEIARAIMTQPALLLLDEPAAGLNLQEKDDLIEMIRWIRREFQLTIWIIEHEMRLVMNLCEIIQVLNFGETIALGNPEEIQRNHQVIEAYLGKEDD
ncbi:MAG: ABC transporter ATP-binding protein [Deltaproteobacteria bacterium]|nr:ABC transporter ATP-binding protein [Deltaproteobacteria bacterium]